MPMMEPELEPAAVLSGFHETFRRLGLNTELTVQLAAQVFALAEVLIARGVVGLDEVNRRQRALEGRLRADSDADNAVQLSEEADKYALETERVEIDCASRLPLCRAACCRLRFALSRQDVEEGAVQWEIARPYLNRQRADGYCVHTDERTLGCQVYDRRPGVCRRYDCRRDTRIWVDFDSRIPNPELAALAPASAV
ncbi:MULTISPECIES: YkgJ family cysteine cluster protein [unclassified Saccharothrix]|uniref:YkgJ family cysteine cluster protein n=1 Tax=unclassified Saccharothrix TaxID=2593673 RepID=UPI00307D4855